MKGKINQYWSASEPVLVEVVTSTAPRSDQYYFVLICIELRSSSLYEATLMALEDGGKRS